MNNTGTRLRRKRSRAGFSLAELLMVLLILSIVTAAAVTGIGSAMRTYKNSVMISEAQTLVSSLSAALEDELRYATAIQAEDSGAVTSYSSARYGTVSLREDEGKLYCGSNPLLPVGAYTDLYVRSSGTDPLLTYNGEVFTIHFQVLDGSDGSVVGSL